jgi:addiction module HigA family antidote
MPRSQKTFPEAPSHPGWLLRERVLPGLGLSVSQAARELRIARQTLHRVLAGKAAISPDMATRLARLSGTTPGLWLERQQRHDIWHSERALSGLLGLIPTHTLPVSLQAEIGLSHDR